MIGRCTTQVQTFHVLEKFGIVGGRKLTEMITIYELKYEIVDKTTFIINN